MGVGGWLTGERALKREGNEFPLVCVFSGSFGVRSIVLCKCSGKYIDIYFILKLTFYLVSWKENLILMVKYCFKALCIRVG